MNLCLHYSNRVAGQAAARGIALLLYMPWCPADRRPQTARPLCLLISRCYQSGKATRKRTTWVETHLGESADLFMEGHIGHADAAGV